MARYLDDGIRSIFGNNSTNLNLSPENATMVRTEQFIKDSVRIAFKSHIVSPKSHGYC